MKKHYPSFPENWLRAGLFTAFIAFSSLNLQAQTAPTKAWDKTFGGNGIDVLRSLQQTSDGGYILGGYSNSGISGDKSQASKGSYDYWVIKLDANGNKSWDKTFGGNGYDVLNSLQQTADGGFILGGTSDSGIDVDKSQASKGYLDFWVVKLDANGNRIWDKSFGGNNSEGIGFLRQTSDGGYILGGGSDSGINGDKSQACQGNSDYWVVKIDANGNKSWDKTFGGDMSDLFWTLQQTSDGGYILGGFSSSSISIDKSQPSKGGNDYWVIKLDTSGDKIWDKIFGGFGTDYLYSLQQTSDRGYILGGESTSGISGDKSQSPKGITDYWVVKLDSSGIKTWDKTLGGSDKNTLNSLQQTTDGGYIFGGSSRSGISGDKSQASKGLDDFWIIKTDGSGNKIWDKTFGGNDEDKLYGIQQTTDGGYILAGSSRSGISGDKSQASLGDTDFWIVKLGGNTTGLKEVLSNKINLYPNPTTGLLTLELSTAQPAEVTIFNALGQQILQKTVAKTDEKVQLDLNKAAKGIYLVQVQTEKQVVVKKIVVE